MEPPALFQMVYKEKETMIRIYLKSECKKKLLTAKY